MSHVLAVLVAATAVVSAGCPASSEEVRPPADQLFFPTGSALLADESILLVTNANSDLRYDSGSISAVSMDAVQEIFGDWSSTGDVPGNRDCEIDAVIPYTLVCNEAEFILADATVRTGNFATELDVQLLDDGSSRLFVAVRGDPSLTWVDFDPVSQMLDCGGSGTVPSCDDDHRLVSLLDDVTVGPLSTEPFGIFVDSANGYVMVTHLTQGAVSLANAPRNGDRPILSDTVGGIFERDPVTQVAGAVGAAGRLPGSVGDRVYVTSRSEERIQTFTVARIDQALPTLVPAEYFFLNGVDPSDDARSIAFSPSGERAYVVNRSPPMLHVLDTSLDETGIPRNELRAAVEVCSSASDIAVGDTGRGDRVYIACFRDGQVWAVDPQGAALESIIDVGRGPQSLSLAVDGQKLFVTNFLEDTVAVVDLRPESPTENRVVLKLGRTRQSGGE